MTIAASNLAVASGFWGNAPPPNQYHRNNTERVVSMSLGKPANRGLRKVWRALTGAAPGAAVVDTITRIAQPTAFQIAAFGGNRSIETVTGPYNGNTTAAQATYIQTQIIDPVSAVQSYPADLSGNGGGGKIQK